MWRTILSPRLRPLLWLVSIYTVLLFLFACRKYAVMNSNSRDTAWMANMLWNSTRGELLFSPYNGMCYLGNHAALIYLLFIPFYWLLPAVPTVLFLQSLLIGASAIPFYLIAERELQETKAALLATIGYLFYPTVVTNHVAQVHIEHLALPFLLAAFYFLLQRRMWGFAVSAAFALLVEEHICLTVFFLGVYALVRKLGLKWVVMPMGLAVGYGLFAFKVLIPHFTGSLGYLPSHYFKSLANTPGELLQVMLTQPLRVLNHILTVDRVVYVFLLVQPLLWITPFVAPELLLVAPSLGINLMADDASFRVIGWHYGPTVGAFLCVAAVFGMRRLAEIGERRSWRMPLRLVLPFGMAVVSLASWQSWLNIGEYIRPPHYAAMRRAIDLIPAEKSVVAPLSMVAHFSNRPHPMHLLQFDPNERVQDTWPRERLYTMDYVILDGNERRVPQDIVTRDLFLSFYNNPDYELVLNGANLFVFCRRNQR